MYQAGMYSRLIKPILRRGIGKRALKIAAAIMRKIAKRSTNCKTTRLAEVRSHESANMRPRCIMNPQATIGRKLFTTLPTDGSGTQLCPGSHAGAAPF